MTETEYWKQRALRAEELCEQALTLVDKAMAYNDDMRATAKEAVAIANKAIDSHRRTISIL